MEMSFSALLLAGVRFSLGFDIVMFDQIWSFCTQWCASARMASSYIIHTNNTETYLLLCLQISMMFSAFKCRGTNEAKD